MKHKQINLSESLDKNSSEMVTCPKCGGEGCDFCFNNGKVSKKKASRFKKNG